MLLNGLRMIIIDFGFIFSIEYLFAGFLLIFSDSHACWNRFYRSFKLFLVIDENDFGIKN